MNAILYEDPVFPILPKHIQFWLTKKKKKPNVFHVTDWKIAIEFGYTLKKKKKATI